MPLIERNDVEHLKQAAAFNEWMRRYIEEPSRFASEWESIRGFLASESNGETPSYGAEAAAYLNRLELEIANR
jgi:hypothetical protein